MPPCGKALLAGWEAGRGSESAEALGAMTQVGRSQSISGNPTDLQGGAGRVLGGLRLSRSVCTEH